MSGYEQQVFANFETATTRALSWGKPQAPPEIMKVEKILRAQDNFYSAKSNRVIRIYLPREDICTEKAFLKLKFALKALLPGLPGDYKRLANYSTSLFEEIRIRIGGFEHTVRDFNLLSAFWQTLEIPEEVKEKQLYDNMGWGPDHIRSIWGQTKQEVIIPLRWIGFERGVFPLDAIYQLSGPLDQYLELVIAEPSTVMETNGVNLDIEIDDLEFHYEQICSEGYSYRNMLMNEIRRNNGYWSFPTIKLYQTPIVSSVTDCNVPHKENNLHSITTVLCDVSKRNDPTVSGKFENYPKDFGAGCIVRSYQTDIKGRLYPLERVDASDQALQSYAAYLRSFGFHDIGMKFTKFPPPIGIDEFNGTVGDAFFFMHLDLHPLTNEYLDSIDAEMVVNKFSLRNENRAIIFKLDTVNAPPPGINLVAYHMVRYNQLMKVGSDGSFQKILM